jgi:ketose-bisphosphate aldolase
LFLTTAEVRDSMLAAREAHLLVPAFNVPYLPMIEAIVGVLRETDSFGLIEVARPDVEHFEAQSLAAVAEEFRRCAGGTACGLHLDHVPVIDEVGERVDWAAMIREGLDCGYHSVMLDASRLPLEENLAAVREVVAMAAPYGAPVEAELGAVLGHEPGPLPPYDELFASGLGFTSAAEAERFVAQTGLDWLSVAVGNVHGAFLGAAASQPKVEARLALDRVRELAQATGVPLVLHGGSGIPAEYLQAAAQEGVVKLNIGTEIRKAYQQARETTGSLAAAQEAVAQGVREIVTERLGIAGSASRLRR